MCVAVRVAVCVLQCVLRCVCCSVCVAVCVAVCVLQCELTCIAFWDHRDSSDKTISVSIFDPVEFVIGKYARVLQVRLHADSVDENGMGAVNGVL